MDFSIISKILSGQPAYRHQQVYQAVYKQLINNWSEAKNLPENLRVELEKNQPLEIKYKLYKDNRIMKAAIELIDGKIIESVLIRNFDGRNTVCVSAQVGCPIGCDFCATGRYGYQRNLTADEIVDQVLLFARELNKQSQRVDNVVFMGMGEPFLNTENVFKAIETLNNKEGLNIGSRSISISTVGITDGIRQLAKLPLQVNLAVSIHAPNDRLRSQLIPINKKYSLEKIFSALNDYLNLTNRKLMLEYVMIAGINDSDKLAEELALLVSKLPKKLVMVNLIPYSQPPHQGKSEYSPSDKQVINNFKRILGKNGIEATIRESLGQNIYGGCGQLAGKSCR